MPTTLDDLQTIKARIADQVQEHLAHSEQTRNELAEQQTQLGDVQQTKGETQRALGMQQAEVARLTSLVYTYTQEALHAIGTSLQAEKERHIFAAQDDLGAAQADLKRLGAALETAAKEERNLVEQCQALAAKLDLLVAKQSELHASYTSFDAQHRDEVLRIHGEQMDADDAEIRAAQAALDTLAARRNADLRQFATALSPWASERVAVDALTTHMGADDDMGISTARREMQQAEETIANAERLRAQSGDDITPTIVARRQQVIALGARVEALRQEAQQRAALQMLREVVPPAPVAEDLAQAQALHAQAQAQVEVVVEELAPQTTKEIYAPKRGMRTFANLGAVPTPQPSLLRPHVKETTS